MACRGQVVCNVLRFKRVIQQDRIGGVRILVRFLLVLDIGCWMVCRWSCGRFWIFSGKKPSLWEDQRKCLMANVALASH